MDVPISVLEWELFLPDRYRVKGFDGEVLMASLMPVTLEGNGEVGVSGGVEGGVPGGVVQETVTVAGQPVIDSRSRKAGPEQVQNAPSANVLSLQRRVAGVLPVRMDIPRAGASYRFLRPLVLDEETSVSFSYKTR
jgi:hypothetical protein